MFKTLEQAPHSIKEEKGKWKEMEMEKLSLSLSRSISLSLTVAMVWRLGFREEVVVNGLGCSGGKIAEDGRRGGLFLSLSHGG